MAALPSKTTGIYSPGLVLRTLVPPKKTFGRAYTGASIRTPASEAVAQYLHVPGPAPGPATAPKDPREKAADKINKSVEELVAEILNQPEPVPIPGINSEASRLAGETLQRELADQFTSEQADAEAQAARQNYLKANPARALQLPNPSAYQTPDPAAIMRRQQMLPQFTPGQISPYSLMGAGLLSALAPQYAGNATQGALETANQLAAQEYQRRLGDFQMATQQNDAAYADANMLRNQQIEAAHALDALKFHTAIQQAQENSRVADLTRSENAGGAYVGALVPGMARASARRSAIAKATAALDLAKTQMATDDTNNMRDHANTQANRQFKLQKKAAILAALQSAFPYMYSPNQNSQLTVDDQLAMARIRETSANHAAVLAAQAAAREAAIKERNAAAEAKAHSDRIKMARDAREFAFKKWDTLRKTPAPTLTPGPSTDLIKAKYDLDRAQAGWEAAIRGGKTAAPSAGKADFGSAVDKLGRTFGF